MTLEIANETSGIVHVALYRRSPLPAEPALAWIIVSPPPQGRAIFSIPRDYRVFVRYSFSPEDPWQPVYQSQALPLRRNQDSLSIREINLDRSTWGALLVRNVQETGLGELRIENDLPAAVWCHVQLGERDVHLPRLLPSHGVLIEALASPFFLAVVSPLVRVGSPLAEHEIGTTEVELGAGKAGAFTVRFTPSQGYRVTRGAPLPAERAPQPKKAAAVPRTKPKAAPRAAEKKPQAQARPKAAVKKQGAAKKPAGRRRAPGKIKSASSNPLPASSSEPRAGA